jgi:hypothetical protein
MRATIRRTRLAKAVAEEIPVAIAVAIPVAVAGRGAATQAVVDTPVEEVIPVAVDTLEAAEATAGGWGAKAIPTARKCRTSCGRQAH